MVSAEVDGNGNDQPVVMSNARVFQPLAWLEAVRTSSTHRAEEWPGD